MRVIAGSAKGRKLLSVPGAGTRPITARVKTALFSILGSDIRDARFLDLFAGTGGVGIEAASRGASTVVFIERTRLGVETIEANAAHCGLSDVCTVVRGDVLSRYAEVAERFGPFDIVFVDPPYGAEELAEIACRLLSGEGLAEFAAVVLQYPGRQELPGVREPDRIKQFGESLLAFFFVEADGV